MAATTVDRQTLVRGAVERQLVFDLKSGQDIPAGAIVCTDNTGEAVNGSDSANLVTQGRCQRRATYASGDRRVVVGRGVFLYANDGTIAKANIGASCTILDNQTVSLAATTTNDIVAGTIDDVTSEGVWVNMRDGKIGS